MPFRKLEPPQCLADRLAWNYFHERHEIDEPALHQACRGPRTHTCDTYLSIRPIQRGTLVPAEHLWDCLEKAIQPSGPLQSRMEEAEQMQLSQASDHLARILFGKQQDQFLGEP